MTPNAIGELIREARRMLGLTQVQLAELAGVGRRFIVDVEAGRDGASIGKVLTVMRALGMDAEVEPMPVTVVQTPSGLVSFRAHTRRTGRPMSVPTRLWALPPEQATATVELPRTVYWSGRDKMFDLGDAQMREYAYQILMEEAPPDVMVEFLDGDLLEEMWDDMFIAPDIRSAWQPAVDVHRRAA